MMVSALNLTMWCNQELSYRLIAAVNFIRIIPTIHCDMLEHGVHLRMLCHTPEQNELHISMKERLHTL